jgi:hypothetical protein
MARSCGWQALERNEQGALVPRGSSALGVLLAFPLSRRDPRRGIPSAIAAARTFHEELPRRTHREILTKKSPRKLPRRPALVPLIFRPPMSRRAAEARSWSGSRSDLRVRGRKVEVRGLEFDLQLGTAVKNGQHEKVTTANCSSNPISNTCAASVATVRGNSNGNRRWTMPKPPLADTNRGGPLSLDCCVCRRQICRRASQGLLSQGLLSQGLLSCLVSQGRARRGVSRRPTSAASLVPRVLTSRHPGSRSASCLSGRSLLLSRSLAASLSRPRISRSLFVPGAVPVSRVSVPRVSVSCAPVSCAGSVPISRF